MNNRLTKFIVPGVILAAGLMAGYVALYSPGYLSSSYYLGGLMFLQVLLAMVWKYEQRFFPFLVLVFLWAGMSVPFSGVWTAGRWAVLAVGAIVGFALYMRSRHPRFSTFHMVALFSVMAALVSAAVSSYAGLSFLKALSLLLLFLYASTGARLALSGRERNSSGDCCSSSRLWCTSPRSLTWFCICPSSAIRILWEPIMGVVAVSCFSGEC